jgi:hypothetical protein
LPVSVRLVRGPFEWPVLLAGDAPRVAEAQALSWDPRI